MDKKIKLLNLFKKIAGISFGVSFIFIISIIANIGREYLTVENARIGFLSFGAIGILFNLLSFESGKHNPIYSFVYWTGTLVVFLGLLGIFMKIQYGIYLAIGGALIIGFSFIIGPSKKEPSKSNDDLLDN